MKNLHVYPSPITNESRIEREVATLSTLGIFDCIEVAGVAAPGLPDTEPFIAGTTVRRFASDAGSNGLLARSVKTLGFGRAVYAHYSSQPLSMINCHSVAALPACVALKRATGARLVYDTHELETETTAARGIRRPLYKMIERLGIKHVDHTFTVSESIEEWYRRAYGVTAIDTLYNFPSESQIGAVADDDYFRTLYSLDKDTTVYLYQGVLGAGRNLDVAAAAFRSGEIPDAVLVFLGYGPMQDEVMGWAAASPHIFFHEAVRPDRLPALTGAADVGLVLTEGADCLSHLYSAPNKIFQYWHAGIPVIASRLPEFERFVSAYGIGVLTESATSRDLIDACSALRQVDAATLQAGLSEVTRDLRWEKYEDLLRVRYEGLVAADRGR